MGKKIIVPGADFRANGIAIPMIIKIKAGQSAVIDGITYTGGVNGEAYELDTIPSTFHESSAVTYLENVTINTSEFQLKAGYFQYQQGLKNISILSPISTTTNLNTVFAHCIVLEEIAGMENFNTEGVTNLSQMFRSCAKLKSVDVTHFDTSACTNFSNMFAGCSELTTIDLSSFNTSNATDISRMFSSCAKLETLILGSGWDMVEKTATDMFYSCQKIASIVAPNCQSTQYGTAGTQLMALITAIQNSGFNATRNTTPLVITCGDNKTVTGTYNHGTGWTWTVQS